MAHYDGVAGVARKITKQYDGVDSVARKTKKAYDGVDGVARLTYTGLYTWAKYTSYVASTSISYGDYKVEVEEWLARIWPLEMATAWDFFVQLGTGPSGVEGEFVLYNDFKYDKATGKFTMLGEERFFATNDTYIDEDVANRYLLGKYVRQGNYVAFTRACEVQNGIVYYLDIGETYLPGDKITTYTYAYRYVEDVQSDNPNAFPEGSTAGYTSTLSNDIRTVYVRVERD